MNIKLTKLVNNLARALLQHNLVIVTVESCTGGWLAQELTSITGSSRYFDRGFVTYSNASKTELLGVDADIIERYGPVSNETAQAMASGALNHSHANIAIAITGIAGPSGGTLSVPVGTVCFAWVGQNLPLQTTTQLFSGDRAAIRLQAVYFALTTLLKVIAAM